MTGYTDFNRAEFNRIDEIYTSNGYEVVNPAKFPIHDSHDGYMRHSIEQLLSCDAILMINGWRYSQGAKLEHTIANAIGMQILYYKRIENGPLAN